MPNEYLGYKWADENEGNNSCPILDITNFIKEKVGIADAPVNDVDWLEIREELLFEITYCAIFYDAAGELTKRTSAFKAYPEDVWKKRLVKTLQELWVWSVRYVKRAVSLTGIGE
jgi:hypothetical protein